MVNIRTLRCVMRRSVSPITGILIGVLLTAQLIGCVRSKDDAHVRPTGFLGDYSMLEPGAEGQAQLRYVNPDIDFGQYNKILIEPVTIWRSEGSDWSAVDPDELDEIADYVLYAFHRQLSGDFKLVQKPGEGVIAFRIALTEKAEAPVVLETASGVLPRIFVGERKKTLSPEALRFLDTVTMEIEVVDTIDGRRIGAAVDRRAGETRFLTEHGQWIEVETAFDYWAGRVKQILLEKWGEAK